MEIYGILLVFFIGIMVFSAIGFLIYIFGYKYRKESKYTGSFLGEKLDDSPNSRKTKVKFELINYSAWDNSENSKKD